MPLTQHPCCLNTCCALRIAPLHVRGWNGLPISLEVQDVGCVGWVEQRHVSAITLLVLPIQGRYEDALPLCEQALAMRNKTLGTNHPDTAISLKNLAAIWEAQVGLLNEDYLLVRICELCCSADKDNGVVAIFNVR